MVPGAAYTCYTLWHWANGEATDLIRKISGKSFPYEQLMDYLKAENGERRWFALQCLTERKVFDPVTRNAVIRQARQDSQVLVKAALHYLQSASAKTGTFVYYETIEDLFLAAVQEELRWSRSRHSAVLSDLHLDRLTLVAGRSKVVATMTADRVSLFRDTPVVRCALEKFDRDPVMVTLVASTVYSAINHALTEVTNEDERSFQKTLMEAALDSSPRERKAP